MNKLVSDKLAIEDRTYTTVSVVGLGYIGLPTAAILAKNGVDVIGLDLSQDVVDTVNGGKVHIVEPELEFAVKSAVNTGKLRATNTPEPAQVFIVAVPTPLGDEGQPELAYVESAIRIIAPVLEEGNLIILESTSPVGTTEKVAGWLAEIRPDLNNSEHKLEPRKVNIAYCPERVLPGQILRELVNNDRIIGGLSPACAAKAQFLYKTFVEGECHITDSRTAELSKLTENAFRDVNIAFANELSVISEKLEIDVWELINLSNRHPRVNILKPGPGVGGHCIAVDPWFIVNSAPQEARLIKTARQVNDDKPGHVIRKINLAAADVERPVLACLGLSFKADIDDLRESPALNIVEQVSKSKLGEILVVEPNIEKLPEYLGEHGCKLVSLKEAIERSNILVVLVDHKEFLTLGESAFKNKVLIDTRGIF